MNTDHRIYDLLIVGAGPAGIAAALRAKQCRPQLRLLLLDRKARPGGKLRFAGGGRCNLSHLASPDELVAAFHREGRFLYPAFHRLPPVALMRELARLGIPCRVADEGRIYPLHMNGKEVEARLTQLLTENQIELALSRTARELRLPEASAPYYLLRCDEGEVFRTKQIILAAGCPACPQAEAAPEELAFFARSALPLAFEEPVAALAPLESPSLAVLGLSGLSVTDAELRLYVGKKKKARAASRGALLFTHRGISGPAALNLSRELYFALASASEPPRLVLDFLPEISAAAYLSLRAAEREDLLRRLPKRLRQRLAERALPMPAAGNPERGNGGGAGNPGGALPDSLFIPKELSCSDLRALDAGRGMQCRGGFSCRDLDPKSMEVKACPGLYLCGDQLALDGPEGGYNLHLAFATGDLAGEAAARRAGR